jgi:DNA-binding NarL/FixJ family response regulator
MQPLRVLIVAPYPTLQYGLRAAVESADEVEVTGLAADLEQALALLDEDQADLLLADADWGESELLALDELPAAPRLILLIDDPALAAELLLAGAQAVLPRDATPEEIVAALRAAYAGLIVLDAQTRSRLALPAAERREPAATEYPLLTGRELQVLELIAQGLPNKSIAVTLGISEHTVKFHVGSLLTKLNAASRSEALAHAIQAGLLAV